MRTIRNLILHCSDSDNPNHDRIEVIRQWHLERGFSDVGYNAFIRKNGTIEIGRSISLVPAQAEGHNHDSVGICLHGKMAFTPEQFDSAAKLCLDFLDIFSLPLEAIIPHNAVNPDKTCPNFKVEKVQAAIIALRHKMGQNH